MSKAGIRIFLAHGPTLSEFLGHLESEFDDAYSLSFVLLEVYFTYTTVHVPVHFCFWWGVPVHYCSCTGTPSEICLDFVIFPTFDANSLHTTSIIHNTSKTNLEFI